jgi:hypothetical protein
MKHAEGLIGQHVAAMRHRPIDRKASSGSDGKLRPVKSCRISPVQIKKNKALIPVDGQLAKFIHFKAGKHECALPCEKKDFPLKIGQNPLLL